MAYQPTTNFGWAMPRGGDQAQISVINQQFTAKADEIVYQTRRMIAPGYIDDGSKTYQPGEIVEYENVDYVCTGTTSGAWDSSKWDSTDMATQIQEAKESGGTNVEANPVEAATADLQKLKVDTTVYGIPDPTVTKTATGNPIEITDGANAPLVKCVTAITGYQSGTGTPSPDNIRPIVAYTEGEIVVRGKNLFDKRTVVQGSTLTPNSTTRCSNRGTKTILVKVGETFTISRPTSNVRYTIAIRNISDDTPYYDSGWKTATSFSFVSQYEGYMELIFSYTTGDITPSKVQSVDFQVERGATATPYEPYIAPTTHTTTYPSAIYRGSEDCVNGEVVTDWGMIASYAGETLPGEWISDRDEYVPGTTPTTGAQVAYELATPTTTSITPTNLPIKSLSGYNHIESSTGDMEVGYITEGYQPLVDLIPEGSGGDLYSTTPAQVGEWIDGSAIMRVTLSGSWTINTGNGSSNIDVGSTYTGKRLLKCTILYNNGYDDMAVMIPPYAQVNGAGYLNIIHPTNTAYSDIYAYAIILEYIEPASRSLSKGSTDSLKADLSEEKKEIEELPETDEKTVKKAQSEGEESVDKVDKVDEPTETIEEKEENAR